jgi:hypothetical protein
VALRPQMQTNAQSYPCGRAKTNQSPTLLCASSSARSTVSASRWPAAPRLAAPRPIAPPVGAAEAPDASMNSGMQATMEVALGREVHGARSKKFTV